MLDTLEFDTLRYDFSSFDTRKDGMPLTADNSGILEPNLAV
jgi:hypothetical protein